MTHNGEVLNIRLFTVFEILFQNNCLPKAELQYSKLILKSPSLLPRGTLKLPEFLLQIIVFSLQRITRSQRD